MNTSGKPQKETEQLPIFEPFPEPRTMPEGWDLSGLLAGSQLSDVKPLDNISIQ